MGQGNKYSLGKDLGGLKLPPWDAVYTVLVLLHLHEGSYGGLGRLPFTSKAGLVLAAYIKSGLHDLNDPVVHVNQVCFWREHMVTLNIMHPFPHLFLYRDHIKESNVAFIGNANTGNAMFGYIEPGPQLISFSYFCISVLSLLQTKLSYGLQENIKYLL